METKDWLGPAVSAAGALVAIVFSIIARAEARRQRRLQSFAFKRQYDTDLRAWANKTLTALTDAVTMTYLPATSLDDNQFALRQQDLLARLSAAADEGRWFFPNEVSGDHSAWKPQAYRGFRPAVLDCVIGAFNELKEVRRALPSKKVRAALVEHRRHFVSLIQARLEPKAREAELTHLLD